MLPDVCVLDASGAAGRPVKVRKQLKRLYADMTPVEDDLEFQ